MTAAQVSLIDEKLAERWKQDVQRTPSFLRGTLPDKPTDMFLQDCFFDVVESVLSREAEVTSSAPGSEGTAKANKSQTVSASIIDQFTSLSKRGSSGGRAEEGNLEFVGSNRILSGDVAAGSIVKYEGYILTSNAKCRAVPVTGASPRKRPMDEPGASPRKRPMDEAEKKVITRSHGLGQHRSNIYNLLGRVS